jgi:hypothetical protein
LALVLEVGMVDRIVLAVGWLMLQVVQVAHDPVVVAGIHSLAAVVPVRKVLTKEADAGVGMRFARKGSAVLEQILAQERLAVEGNLAVVAAMEGTQSLVALKEHLVVGTTVDYQQASRNVRWQVPVVPSFVDDRLQALYPVVLSKDPKTEQLVVSVAVAAARQPAVP